MSRIREQVQRLDFRSSEARTELISTLAKKYGVRVECESSYLSIFQLNDDSCFIGLSALDVALAKIKQANGGKEFALHDVQFLIAEHGHWEGITLADRTIKIPYDADPNSMVRFINYEIKILYGMSLEQLAKHNQGIADSIQKLTSVKVVPDPSLNPHEFHDGLKRLQAAVMLSLAGRKGQNQMTRFGPDTIVLSYANSKIYQSGTELQLMLDARDRPGQMYENIITALKQPNFQLTRWLPVSGWLSGSVAMTSSEVTQFRRDRHRIEELMSWHAKNFPNKISVKCVLDNSLQGVTIPSCVSGLDSLQKAVTQFGPPQLLPQLKSIRIGRTLVWGHSYEQGEMLLSDKLSPQEMLAAISQKSL